MAKKAKLPIRRDDPSGARLADYTYEMVRRSGLSSGGNIHVRVMTIVLTALVTAAVGGNQTLVFTFAALSLVAMIWLHKTEQ